MQCRRRIGGWPQVALVAAVDGRLYEADGILPTLAVMERSIAVQSGRISASSVALPQSAADTLLASQLAARAFSAGDVGEYQRLMALGRPRQPRGELRRRGDRVPCRLCPAAEGAGARQPRHRHRADAPGAAGLRSGPLRRGGHAVPPGGDAGAARQRQGGGRTAQALPGAARTEPGAQGAGTGPAGRGRESLCRRRPARGSAKSAAGRRAAGVGRRDTAAAEPAADDRSHRAVGVDRIDRGSSLPRDRAAPVGPLRRKRGGHRLRRGARARQPDGRAAGVRTPDPDWCDDRRGAGQRAVGGQRVLNLAAELHPGGAEYPACRGDRTAPGGGCREAGQQRPGDRTVPGRIGAAARPALRR